MSFGSSGANPNNDLQLPQPPDDAVSAVRWSPQANLLSASSWDKTVRIWEISDSGQAAVKLGKEMETPIITHDWAPDGAQIFTAHIDGKVEMIDLASQQTQQVGQHESGLQCLQYIPEVSLLCSAGWDKQLHYWDCRQAKPAMSVQMPHGVFSIDCKHPLLVTADSNRHVGIFHLSDPSQPYKYRESPLAHQIRQISAFPDCSGFIITSVEGRCALQHVEENMSADNFSFRCHRQGTQVYAVNDVTFHPLGTFATCGSDGKYTFWDKGSRQRLKEFQKMQNPITSIRFNANGMMCAYAVSYDWYKGSEGASNAGKNNVFVHGITEIEIAPRPKKK